jgi:hypothetical protein
MSGEQVAFRGVKPSFSDDNTTFAFTPVKYAHAITYAAQWNYGNFTTSDNNIYIRNALIGKIYKGTSDNNFTDACVYLCLPIDDSCAYSVCMEKCNWKEPPLDCFKRLLINLCKDKDYKIETPPNHVLKSAAEILYESGLDFSKTLCTHVPQSSKVYDSVLHRSIIPDKRQPNSIVMYEVTTLDGHVVGGVYKSYNNNSPPVTAARANGRTAVRALNCAKGYTDVCDTA